MIFYGQLKMPWRCGSCATCNTDTSRAFVSDGNSWRCQFPKALRNAGPRRLRIRCLSLLFVLVVDIVAAAVVIFVAIQTVSCDLLAVATNCQFDHSMFERIFTQFQLHFASAAFSLRQLVIFSLHTRAHIKEIYLVFVSHNFSKIFDLCVCVFVSPDSLRPIYLIVPQLVLNCCSNLVGVTIFTLPSTVLRSSSDVRLKCSIPNIVSKDGRPMCFNLCIPVIFVSVIITTTIRMHDYRDHVRPSIGGVL